MQTTALVRDIYERQDHEAVEQLLRIIKDEHMERETRRWRGRNRLVDDADVESHFLEGCYKACLKARPDIGDPLRYVLWKGRLAVVSLFKQRLRQGVRARCLSCGWSGALLQVRGVRCAKCGKASAMQTWQTVVAAGTFQPPPHSHDRLLGEREREFEWATYRVQVEELRARLSGRVLELFDLLVVEAINAQTCQNYLKEIAGRWGVSAPSVAYVLRQLREAVLAYYEEG